jgi:glutathione S-transferase
MTQVEPMMTLYHTELSGNCHKARLLLALLNVAHERVWVDLMKGRTKPLSFSS